ncbi:TldD/PmbA family protein [Microcoleus sp. FACHB-831]|uniref:TldD/PmbA family protein n=1 Tax=Microcoleus sp. FACHB-831 TaxID=2692827 RepID=UPI001683D359|nr:TldD/PmbA family protein [Microcoleus sp. FACHB-831]MBD1923543.1 TldD/PmbA family protein [Microcoleus sp. FACHB-831]
MNNSPEESLAEQLLDLAAKSGAQAADVYQSRSLSYPVFFEANRLKQLESAQSEGTTLRLWVDGRPGLAVAYGPVEPQALVDKAIALSTLNEPEQVQLITNRDCVYPDLGETIPVGSMVKQGKEAIAMVREVYPEVLCTAQWECEIETTRLLNSEGLDCRYTDTTASCYLSAEWVRGEDFLSVSDGQQARDKLDVATLTQRILQRLSWALENVAPPTGRIPILFTDKAADMLWETVQAAVNGKRVLEGASPWSDRQGKQVTSTSLTISQQPQVGPFSCPFDDEGSPTQHLVFIKEGVLQMFYTDLMTGRALGTSSTGNGFRPGLGSYPTPGLVNLLIHPGKGSLIDLISQMDEGLIVDQMLGGATGISGDFSINVDLGYRVQKGEIVGRVKDTMVAGNIYTALKQLVALGDDADWNGPVLTPSVIVEGLSVTGKT